LLASLEERSTYREFDCFLEVENKNGLEGYDLADKTAGDRFVLFWGVIALSAEKTLPCFQK